MTTPPPPPCPPSPCMQAARISLSSASTPCRSTCRPRPPWTASTPEAWRTRPSPPGTPLPAGMSTVYRRAWNTTVARFETAVAALEAADAGRGPLRTRGRRLRQRHGGHVRRPPLAGRAHRPHVVAVRPLYGGTDHLLATGLLGTQVTLRRAGRGRGRDAPDTGLVIVESPANPTLDLLDIGAWCRRPALCPCWWTTPSRRPFCRSPSATAPCWFCTARRSTSAATAMPWAAWSRPTRDAAALRPMRTITGGVLHPWRPTCCTAACPRCRCGCAPSRRRPAAWPPGWPSTRRCPRSTTPACPAGTARPGGPPDARPGLDGLLRAARRASRRPRRRGRAPAHHPRGLPGRRRHPDPAPGGPDPPPGRRGGPTGRGPPAAVDRAGGSDATWSPTSPKACGCLSAAQSPADARASWQADPATRPVAGHADGRPRQPRPRQPRRGEGRRAPGVQRLAGHGR